MFTNHPRYHWPDVGGGGGKGSPKVTSDGLPKVMSEGGGVE